MKTAGRRRGEKSPRVGMLRILENIRYAPMLEDFPRIQHHHTIGETFCQREVVGNEQHPPSCHLDLKEHICYLFPYKRIQALRRFIRDEPLRGRQGHHRRHDALRHTAGELVRMGRIHTDRIGKTVLFQLCKSTLPALLFPPPQPFS